MKKCREATTQDPKAKHYINILMSSVEYTTFIQLMRIMRPVAEQRLLMKSESKEVSKGGAGSKNAKDTDDDGYDNLQSLKIAEGKDDDDYVAASAKDDGDNDDKGSSK